MSGAKRWLKRLWPRRLVGQTIVLLLLALLSAQIVSALIVRFETREFYRGAQVRFMAERISPFVDLMRGTPRAGREPIAKALTSRRRQFWLSDSPAVAAFSDTHSDNGDDDELRQRARELMARIAGELGQSVSDDIRVNLSDHPHRRGHGAGEDDHGHGGRRLAEGMSAAPADADHAETVVSVSLGDGQWMNAAFDGRGPRRLLRSETWITFFVTAAVVSLIMLLALRRLTKPLGALSDAARRLGRGEDVAPLPLAGPADVKDSARAFNEMQRRLRRFVTDRTQMLAAISHDLRTPITSLRLRAEMIDDEELRERIVATLDEMQQMVEASLSFARAEATNEDTRQTDLAALLGSIADDLTDLGKEVSFSGRGRTLYPCRPMSLSRAFRNLIENAIRYGSSASVELEGTPESGLRIVIEDNGPGIPDTDLERVFEPFVRLEESRSTETGGIGLGLAIARDIVARHGGRIDLENRPGGGLRVTVSLPAADA